MLSNPSLQQSAQRQCSSLRTLLQRPTAVPPSLMQQRRAASGGAHYNPPTGRLFGEAPGPRQKEGWENIFMYGFFGGFVLFGVLYLYKPDSTVQTWALAEAKKKLEAEGGIPKYDKS